MSVTTIDEIVRKLRVKDVRRTICGIATEFGVRARNGVFWKADQFKDFLDCATTLPLRVDHGPIIDSRGCIKYPTHGILALAEVDHAEGYGDQLLSDIAAITSQVWLDRCWGLSLAAHYTDEIAVPYECSVTRSPAFPGCQVLGVGESAIESWMLLTEMTAGIGASQRRDAPRPAGRRDE